MIKNLFKIRYVDPYKYEHIACSIWENIGNMGCGMVEYINPNDYWKWKVRNVWMRMTGKLNKKS